MVVADLAMAYAWMIEPHARPWWGRGRTAAGVAEEYTPYIEGQVPIHAYVVEYGGRPIGLCTWERFRDFPDLARAYGVDDLDSTNMDVLIGDPGFAYRGLGAPLVRRFLDEVIFRAPGVTGCVIDPARENRAAIRAYAKAGFRHVRDALDPEDGETMLHLMELARS